MEEKNTMKDFTTSSYGDEKMSKEKELNSSMSIKEQPQDEYTRKLHNIGGDSND